MSVEETHHVDRVERLERRVARLEDLLSAFASMVGRTSADVDRMTAAVETRVAGKDPIDSIISFDKRTQVAAKAMSMMKGGIEVPHASITRVVRGLADGRQVSAVMTWLASEGYVAIVRVEKPEGGRPTTMYRLLKSVSP